MVSNLSDAAKEKIIAHPITDDRLPFSEYIEKTRQIIRARREELHSNKAMQGATAEQIVTANTPFELYPSNPILEDGQLKYGVLLIHGLLDSPFSVRDIGLQLQTNGIFSRSVLLPGQGTHPNDLLHVTYQEWIQAVRYGVESMRNQVKHLFLIGYSTGAALAIYQALEDKKVEGVILISPAIRIRAPADTFLGWELVKWLNRNKTWFHTNNETDYAKYRSITFNAVAQVAALTSLVAKEQQKHPLNVPILMIVSREDETISFPRALALFSQLKNKNSKLLLYCSSPGKYADSRIVCRQTCFPEQNIRHFSHVSLPFSPNNPHYGKNGDYFQQNKEDVYGAYNPVVVSFYDRLKSLGLIKQNRRELMYNPDFEFMSKEIVEFVKS